MKGLHLTISYYPQDSGVVKKIQSQIRAFENNGYEKMYMGILDNLNNLIIEDENLGRIPRYRAILDNKKFYDKLLEFIKRKNIKFIYYRFNGFSEPSIIQFFKKIKKLGVLSVMEIPTYPYKGELKKNRFYYMDLFTRRFLANNFQYIITFSNESKIFGKQTINISNGIDFNKIPIIKQEPHSGFNLIGVANLCYWHGYDRVLYGIANLKNLNETQKVKFNIVSGTDTEETKRLRHLAKELKIEDLIIFHGNVTGKRLDDLFNKSDFAIGSLGRHRNGITCLKTLKNVEYAARGIPFIYSESNDDFNNRKYIMRAEPTDAPLDILKIIEFKEKLKIQPHEIRDSISYLSWNNQIKKIQRKIEK